MKFVCFLLMSVMATMTLFMDGSSAASTHRSIAICQCTNEMKQEPMCGVDGVTYANECNLHCAEMEKASDGPCEDNDTEKPCICTKHHSPVCGKDGKTYSNECMIKCAGVEKVKDEPCTDILSHKKCTCHKEVSYVCGKDGKTYKNECLMKCNGVEKKFDSPCGLVTK